LLFPQEGIALALSADGGAGTVPGVNDGSVRQDHQLGMDAIHKLVSAASGKVVPADTEIEKGIAAEDHAFSVKTDAAGGMTGGVQYHEMQVTYIEAFATLKRTVGGSCFAHGKSESTAATGWFECTGFIFVYEYLAIGGIFYTLDAADVVGVTVGQDDVFYVNAQFFDSPDHSFRLITGVYYHRFLCILIRHDIAVSGNHSQLECLDNHFYLFPSC
jgi:hypothetical protein